MTDYANQDFLLGQSPADRRTSQEIGTELDTIFGHNRRMSRHEAIRLAIEAARQGRCLPLPRGSGADPLVEVLFVVLFPEVLDAPPEADETNLEHARRLAG